MPVKKLPTAPLLPNVGAAAASDTAGLMADTDPFLGDSSCFDDFEGDPVQALLLLMHNTNLASCPALQDLRDLPQEDRDDPAVFGAVIARCSAEVMAIVSGMQDARPRQLAEYYDARDPRRALYSCAACGVREYTREDDAYERFTLECLAPVFEYSKILEASGEGEHATPSAKFTRLQQHRMAHARSFVDAKSGVSCDNMLDFFKHPVKTHPVVHVSDCMTPDGSSSCDCAYRYFHLHRRFVDPPFSDLGTGVPSGPDYSALLCARCAADLRRGVTPKRSIDRPKLIQGESVADDEDGAAVPAGAGVGAGDAARRHCQRQQPERLSTRTPAHTRRGSVESARSVWHGQ